MFSSITSQIKATIKDTLQQTSQHAPTSQQNNNPALQIPAPWTAQFMHQYSCWLYVNTVTHQQSWVHPSQLLPQPHTGYQTNTFPLPQQRQAQPHNYDHTGFSPQQQQEQLGFAQFSPSVFPPPPQQLQQSPSGRQSSLLPFQSQQAPPPHTQPFSPAQQQHQQFGFHGPPGNQYHQQGVAKPAIPPKKNHTARNITLGLGALVATVVGVDILSDGADMLSDGGDIGADSLSSGDAASAADNPTAGQDYGTADYSNALALDQQATALNSAQNAVMLQGSVGVMNASLPVDSSYSYDYA